ncbi:PMS1 protein homolog 1-like [Diachasmimorpha longicaudata]|uniref:PMS1 protein homolog 1-like n=1 Tax=Diachasmimorpha longicaudata TaxID=58733 RepID=UPI0030B905AB
MAIAALDKSTIKQITSTQVITSVYSVVKELVENALDGGANSVDIYLEDKGLAFIEVKDNGKGITKTDSAYMGLPSYTSKISDMSDLESLQTYGFRGEALNSLCKVSDVKVITRTHEDDHARCYTLSHEGRIDKAEFCNRATGTTVQARSLFKSVPVRRQIMSNKGHANESVKSIENLLRDFGICRPALRISYRVDDITFFTKIPADTEEHNIVNIFGKKFVSQYETLNFNDSDLDVRLMVPKKDLTDLSSISQVHYQHIFVNGRPVILKELEKLILKTFSAHFVDKMSSRKKPVFFLTLTVPPSTVDVNLEPNKTTILLVNHSSIAAIITDLLSAYYQVNLEPPEHSSEPLETSSLSSSTLNDSESPETGLPSPPPKRRRLEKARDASSTDEDKENLAQNPGTIPGVTRPGPSIGVAPPEALPDVSLDVGVPEMPPGVTPSDKVPMTQLLEVNLGEDFDIDEIDALPTLDDEQLRVLEKTLASPPENSSNVQITASQWSKGHLPFNLPGKTDVSIVCTTAGTPASSIKGSSSNNPEANRMGFQRFSKDMRPTLVRDNPPLNLVELAKLLTEKWKGLTPGEREHYREVGMQEAASRVKASQHQVKIPKAKDSEETKKRMLKLLDNMKTKGSKEKANLVRTIVPWKADMQTLTKAFRGRRGACRQMVVGKVGDEVWIARTNMQLWSLDVERLFEGLKLREYEREKTPEFIEHCLRQWINENDSMELMHPIFDFSTFKEHD